MTFDTIQQLIRIAAYFVGGYVLGQAVTQGELFQQAVAGLISLAAFLWWYFWERARTS